MTDDAPRPAAISTPGGRGVNQRAEIKMTEEEVRSFVDDQRTMTMCTLNHDGTIHAVAMWYGFLDGCLAIETKAKSQKARNLVRNPAMTVLIEAGERYEELRGVELVGRAEIVEDEARIRALGVSVYERYYGPYNEEAAPFVDAMLNKRIVAKLHVDRTVSWDHRKLAGTASASPGRGLGVLWSRGRSDRPIPRPSRWFASPTFERGRKLRAAPRRAIGHRGAIDAGHDRLRPP